MKIAYILHTFPKISESFILNEIVELIKKGHDISIFSMHRPKEKVMHREVENYKILERTHYFTLLPSIKAPFHYIRYLMKTLYNGGLMSPLKLLKIPYFAAAIEETRADLIHTHFAFMGKAARKISHVTGVPYSLTTHAVDIYMNPDFKELRETMDDAAVVVTISDYNKNYLEKEVKTKSRIEVVRCGIDLAKFDVRKRSRGTKNKKKIKLLCVGRLIEKKGIEYLIKALPLLLVSVPDCELTIIGSGPLYKDLLKLTRALGVGRNVYFKSSVSDAELTQYYIDSDIFVLPCVIARNGDRDGIPVSIMEAIAMGLPVISTNISGIPELVKDGAGILVPPKDEKAIADAIIELHYLKSRNNNIDNIKNIFNLEKEVAKLERIFKLIRNRG